MFSRRNLFLFLSEPAFACADTLKEFPPVIVQCPQPVAHEPDAKNQGRKHDGPGGHPAEEAHVPSPGGNTRSDGKRSASISAWRLSRFGHFAAIISRPEHALDAASAVATQEATAEDSNWLTQQAVNATAVALRKQAKPANGYRHRRGRQLPLSPKNVIFGSFTALFASRQTLVWRWKPFPTK